MGWGWGQLPLWDLAHPLRASFLKSDLLISSHLLSHGSTIAERQLGLCTHRAQVLLPPCPHFTEAETKTPGGEGTCPGPHREQVTRPQRQVRGPHSRCMLGGEDAAGSAGAAAPRACPAAWNHATTHPQGPSLRGRCSLPHLRWVTPGVWLLSWPGGHREPGKSGAGLCLNPGTWRRDLGQTSCLSEPQFPHEQDGHNICLTAQSWKGLLQVHTKGKCWEFPGGPVVRTSHSQC